MKNRKSAVGQIALVVMLAMVMFIAGCGDKSTSSEEASASPAGSTRPCKLSSSN